MGCFENKDQRKPFLSPYSLGKSNALQCGEIPSLSIELRRRCNLPSPLVLGSYSVVLKAYNQQCSGLTLGSALITPGGAQEPYMYDVKVLTGLSYLQGKPFLPWIISLASDDAIFSARNLEGETVMTLRSGS